MTTRDELHTLVDHLADEAAADALAYVSRLAQDPYGQTATAQERLAQRIGPSAVSGTAFATQPPPDLATLAAQRGVQPVTRFEDLLVDIWPEDEDVDDFIATLRSQMRIA